MRPSYATVASTLALVVALGTGGAYAADHLPKNSVGAKQLKSNAVSSAKVKDGSLTAADLAAGVVPPSAAGTAMGGDLTGTFPNPRLNPAAPTGLVKGSRLSNQVALPGSPSYVTLLTVPGLGPVTAKCLYVGGTSWSLEVDVQNTSGAAVGYLSQYSSEDPVLDATDGGTIPNNATIGQFLGTSSGNSIGKQFRFAVTTGPQVVVDVDALLSPGGSGGCGVLASAISG